VISFDGREVTYNVAQPQGTKSPGVRRDKYSVVLMVDIMLIRRAPSYTYAMVPSPSFRAKALQVR
jgi:hypothetical protein